MSGISAIRKRTKADHQTVRRTNGDNVPVVLPGVRCGSNCLFEEGEARNGKKASQDEGYESITGLGDPEEQSRVCAVHSSSESSRVSVPT